MFDIFAEDPTRGARFSMLFSRADEPSKMLVDNYPWDKVRTFVDVGGSHGSIAIGLANQFPAMTCIVQDLPDTVAEGNLRLPANLRDRVTFMAQ
jgi:16S rRNA G1207 methylase RsmC